MKLVASMVLNALRAAWRIAIISLFLLSLAFSISTASLGLAQTVLASAIEALTGRPQAKSVATKEKLASKSSAALAEANDEVAKLKRKLGSLEVDLDAAKLKASRMEGRAIGLGLRAEKAEREFSELAMRTGPKKVILDGAEVAIPEAVARVTDRVKVRTAKVASADVGATFGQSIPWIGVAVVVAATTYDLKTACDNMQDMHALEVAFDPSAANDPSVQEVCGFRVPSQDEIWATIKASPGQAWEWAKAAFPELPEMPDMPEIDWTFWD